MGKKFKSDVETKTLAARLKMRRVELGYTLKNIEESLRINCGQLSRFEAGDFKTRSGNLQKLCNFLQITMDEKPPRPSELGLRLENFAALSPRHRAAAEQFLNVLEHLC